MRFHAFFAKFIDAGGTDLFITLSPPRFLRKTLDSTHDNQIYKILFWC